MYIENVIIGNPLVHPMHLLAEDEKDWNELEKTQTHFTSETYLPKILVEIGLAQSANQIRKNSPQLNITFDKSKLGFIKMKVNKKHFLYIVIGEDKEYNW